MKTQDTHTNIIEENYIANHDDFVRPSWDKEEYSNNKPLLFTPSQPIPIEEFVQAGSVTTARYNLNALERKMLFYIQKEFFIQYQLKQNINNGLFKEDYLNFEVTLKPKDFTNITQRHDYIKKSLVKLFSSSILINTEVSFNENGDKEFTEEMINIFSSLKVNGQYSSFTEIEGRKITKINLKFTPDFIKKCLCLESKILDNNELQAIKYTQLDYNLISEFRHVYTIRIYEQMMSFFNNNIKPITFIIFNKQKLKDILLKSSQSEHYSYEREDLFLKIF